MNRPKMIAAVILVFSPILVSQTNLSLTLVFEKDQFLVGEPIPFGVELTNTGTSEVEVTSPANQVGCWFEMFDAQGNKIKYSGPLYTVLAQTETLKPGGQIFALERANQLFGRGLGLATAHKILEPGIYTLRAKYQRTAKDSVITSSSFAVVEPSGTEAQAFKSFMEIIREARGGGSITTAEQFVTHLQNFETQFPQSIYTPVVLVILEANYAIVLNQKDKGNEVFDRLLAHFPDYATVEPGILENRMKHFNNKESKRSFVSDLLQRAKGKLARWYFSKVVLKLAD